ncbi:AMP-binding protein [Nocardioides coralli]|uniref:AMP-binding protein n=1 Tax=Nocardioides coralli TaxID=2872154 RepID=UPI001CA3B95F|nr:AMP-binding protein [Nocardioides coralli]QZY29969.1 AMP-binding protein [Nocardioides coralli]
MTSLLTRPELAAPAVLDLARHGDAVAVRTRDEVVTYADLGDRVGAVGDALGPTRRLVLVEGANTLASLTTYLAALTRGHVVLLAPPGRPARALAEAWDPDVVAAGDTLDVRREGTGHDLHPDLALLLSTSGSTGSPRLVRLSHDNLRSNAAAIADYLRLTGDDRAITSLPLHYCYGLSVVHSHLLVGAQLVLTDLSVVDGCFWDLAADAGVTSFAGVPYTFDLLERSGFSERELPSLRYVTQAGGRLGAERVLSWHERGRRAGWDLVVMYGQTEATARMAWLPPDQAPRHPGAIGVPVPGGSFRLEPVPGIEEPDVGELVYTGPNVMLGYAERPADLAAGATLAELRTGDLARFADGVYEVVGRRGRQVKLFGLRVDLDHLESVVSTADAEVRCVVVDDTLHAFTTTPRSSDRLRAAVAEASGLPTSAVLVTVLAALPRTRTGKPDLAALAEQARLVRRDSTDHRPGATPAELRDDYALVLGRPDATVGDTFVGLGGDSLSYVELATRLGDRVGQLPPDWHTRTITDLARPEPERAGSRVDTSIVLRAVAILAIVGTHANLLTVVGGAHLLLAVAGWNFARFQLAAPTRRDRLRNGLASLAQLVVPASLWIGGVALLTGFYEPATAVFLNGLLGSDTWTVQWQFWFLEALVWMTAGTLAVLALPGVDRLERRAPYAVAIGLVLAGLAVRFAWVGLEAGATERYTTGVVAWWFLLGWAAARADTTARRVTVTLLVAIGTIGFFDDLTRELLVVAGIALLVHVPALRVPRRWVAPLSVLASSSLFVYLTHWQVYPHLEDVFPLGATLASFAVGIGYWWAARPALRRLGRMLHG